LRCLTVESSRLSSNTALSLAAEAIGLKLEGSSPQLVLLPIDSSFWTPNILLLVIANSSRLVSLR
jgi:hypothetical protein